MKANAILNGEWGRHIHRFEKRKTSKKRRRDGRKQIKEQIKEMAAA